MTSIYLWHFQYRSVSCEQIQHHIRMLCKYAATDSKSINSDKCHEIMTNSTNLSFLVMNSKILMFLLWHTSRKPTNRFKIPLWFKTTSTVVLEENPPFRKTYTPCWTRATKEDVETYKFIRIFKMLFDNLFDGMESFPILWNYVLYVWPKSLPV